MVETPDGSVMPVEVKVRGRIDREDWQSVGRFVEKFRAPWGVLVTRDLFRWEPKERVLLVPLLDFLLAF